MQKIDMSGNSSERFVAAVDFGTKTTALAVARIEGNNTQIVFYKTAPSAGILHSAIAGVTKVEAVLKGLIDEAEKDLNIKISQIVTGLPPLLHQAAGRHRDIAAKQPG